jgi:hypothetical protein
MSVPTVNMLREEVQQGEEVMKIDFSSVNLQYLIHVRDIAREDGKIPKLRRLCWECRQNLPHCWHKHPLNI